MLFKTFYVDWLLKADLPWTVTLAIPWTVTLALPWTVTLALPWTVTLALPWTVTLALPWTVTLALPWTVTLALPWTVTLELWPSPYLELWPMNCDPRLTLNCDPRLTLNCDQLLTLNCDPHLTLNCDPSLTLNCDPGRCGYGVDAVGGPTLVEAAVVHLEAGDGQRAVGQQRVAAADAQRAAVLRPGDVGSRVANGTTRQGHGLAGHSRHVVGHLHKLGLFWNEWSHNSFKHQVNVIMFTCLRC